MTKNITISEKLLSWLWRILLIGASAVPIAVIIVSWYQSSFEIPMPKTVLDSVTANPVVFSVFVVLIVGSFAVQYFFGSPATRKHKIRLRTPILILIGPVIVLIISTLAWWQSDASLTVVLSDVAQKPFMSGSLAGLTVGSLILAFVMSTREEQKRCLKVLITLASVFLMFGGPTYVIYALKAVEVPYSFAALTGLVSFMAGIIIFLRFVSKETQK